MAYNEKEFGLSRQTLERLPPNSVGAGEDDKIPGGVINVQGHPSGTVGKLRIVIKTPGTYDLTFNNYHDVVLWAIAEQARLADVLRFLDEPMTPDKRK